MLELRRPDMKLVQSYLSFIDEMHKNNETVWETLIPKLDEDLNQFVQRLLNAENSPTPPLVPETSYWAYTNNQVVGRIALRHRLNQDLLEFGGHIGYEVRPSARRKGFAKEMLRLLLQTPKAKEIGRLLLTCAPDNVASNKTIQFNGGVLTKTAFVESRQRNTNYYWIDLRD